MAESQKKAPQAKAARQDDSVMGTNNSSIVSKRSVERLYYPDEPHFFRYFVKKPQRRAPLINRGYWLRMKAIDHIVQQFLVEPSDRQKVVINLGCGYDPNPWQCLTRYPEACKDVKFIDVDYIPLMVKKRDIVRSTSELKAMLTNVVFAENGNILLRSDQYLQVGCDLRDLSTLAAVLASAVDLENCLLLFIAEVSITYMTVEAADNLIKWTSGVPNARFCLLEQILPEGPDHPFAKTMTAHFEKLQTPLRAAKKYPTTGHQQARFRTAGWPDVRAKNLWELWGSSDFLSPNQRRAIDYIEPFDEWEEFALFGLHYFLLFASNCTQPHTPSPIFSRAESPLALDSPPIHASIGYTDYGKSRGCRRFAASLPIRGLDRKQELRGNFAGMGLKSRLRSCDIFTPTSNPGQPLHDTYSPEVPSARMCHTVTDLGDTGALLVGGRRSPEDALRDCWLYHKWTNTWERVDDLPAPRYRHSAIIIGNDSVLIVGGKSDSGNILDDFLLWNRRLGWTRCTCTCTSNTETMGLDHSEHDGLKAYNLNGPTVFGAVLVSPQPDYLGDGVITGILMGGIGQDGYVSQDVWYWVLDIHDDNEVSIHLEKSCILGTCVNYGHKRSLARFGATVVRHAGQDLIIGGVARDILLPLNMEIIVFHMIGRGASTRVIGLNAVGLEGLAQRPLLVGCSVASSRNSLVIMGGGAVCFSFGTFWNTRCFSLRIFASQREPLQTGEFNPCQGTSELWKYLDTVDSLSAKVPNHKSNIITASAMQVSKITTVPRRVVASAAAFAAIVCAARPVIIGNLDLGRCTEVWTSRYLKERIGHARKVVVHQASTPQMDFVSKNFEYVTMPFGKFMDAVDNGEKLYLRSLSAEKPSEIPADLERDFPDIADDFQLPPELGVVREKAHSSPLRISGPVTMWLHYDVMGNILCQIRGSKRLLLFPPSDVQYLRFSHGSSSSSTDVFNTLGSGELAETHPHEAILHPGDVLFIPPCWLHTASPTEGVNVAVNVFFRNLEGVYAAGKDVYGNRDIQAYEKGRQDVARIAKSFNNLAEDVRNFYMLRLAEELREMAGSLKY